MNFYLLFILGFIFIAKNVFTFEPDVKQIEEYFSISVVAESYNFIDLN